MLQGPLVPEYMMKYLKQSAAPEPAPTSKGEATPGSSCAANSGHAADQYDAGGSACRSSETGHSCVDEDDDDDEFHSALSGEEVLSDWSAESVSSDHNYAKSSFNSVGLLPRKRTSSNTSAAGVTMQEGSCQLCVLDPDEAKRKPSLPPHDPHLSKSEDPPPEMLTCINCLVSVHSGRWLTRAMFSIALLLNCTGLICECVKPFLVSSVRAW